MQLCVSWALGRPSFGIAPPGPLKMLLIQAENDDGDLAEMRDGVRTGLRLGEEAAQAAFQNVIVVRDDSSDSSSGPVFISRLEALLAEHCPDLLCIDPALG